MVNQDVTQYDLKKRKLVALPHPYDYEVHWAIVWSIGRQLLQYSSFVAQEEIYLNHA